MRLYQDHGSESKPQRTILANRVSYNDTKIVDVLVKPAEISDEFVQTVREYIDKNQEFKDFLMSSATRVFAREVDMYAPLVRRTCLSDFEYSYSEQCNLLGTITDYNVDDDPNNNRKSDEQSAHNKGPDGQDPRTITTVVPLQGRWWHQPCATC